MKIFDNGTLRDATAEEEASNKSYASSSVWLAGMSLKLCLHVFM